MRVGSIVPEVPTETNDGTVEERQRRLRATYTDLARAVKQKVELRIHRVPRKFWDMKMGDLLKSAEGEEALRAIMFVLSGYLGWLGRNTYRTTGETHYQKQYARLRWQRRDRTWLLHGHL